MGKDFYDKVAEKFGNYNTPAESKRVFPNGDPEGIFKEKVLGVSGPDKLVLDVGCADGRFTLSIASSFRKVTAIDISEGMLAAARRNQAEQGISNVEFLNINAHNMGFAQNTFDVVYDRRGPNDFPAYFKVLKPGGCFILIDIGDQDTREIKEVFGRGQGYEKWDQSSLERDRKALEDTGFEVIYSKDFQYDEYYPSIEDLDVFLQGVPIFEDYDPKKDRAHLEKYVGRQKTEKGINLPRHRSVLVALKNN